MGEIYWIWLLLGVAFLAALPLAGGHLLLIDLGVAGLVLALVTAAYPAMAWSDQLLLYLATTLALMPVCYELAFRLTAHRRARLVAPADDYAGMQGVIVRRGHGIGVRLGEEVLPVRSQDGVSLAPGDAVTVERVAGITAWVRRRDR